MNKALPEIQESLEELRERLRLESRARKKQRLQALYLLKRGQAKSRTRSGALPGVSRRTVGEWLDRYATEGLEGLLEIRTHSNRKYSLTEEQDASLREKLTEPEGFPGYKAAHVWVNETFSLDLDYKVVHQIVRDRYGAMLKAARKSHTKNPEVAEMFRANLGRALRGAVPVGESRPVRFFSQDESRFGLITVQRRRITRRGVKPVGVFQQKFGSFYLYGAVEPSTGRSFFSETGKCNSATFGNYLKGLSGVFPDSLNLLHLDNGRHHKAKALEVPENVALVFLAPYSPELNPIERVFRAMKDGVAWLTFDTLDPLREKVQSLLTRFTDEQLQSLTGYPYILQALQRLNDSLLFEMV